MCGKLSKWLGKKLDKKAFDLFQLVRRVEGYETELSSHLGRAAIDTLCAFVSDLDYKWLVQHRGVAQPPHTDNTKCGSFFCVILFGCGKKGQPYAENVPCTYVCRYDNMASTEKGGRCAGVDCLLLFYY